MTIPRLRPLIVGLALSAVGVSPVSAQPAAPPSPTKMVLTQVVTADIVVTSVLSCQWHDAGEARDLVNADPYQYGAILPGNHGWDLCQYDPH